MNEFECGETVDVPDTATLWRVEGHSDNCIFWSDELDRWIPRVPDALVFNKELSMFWSEHLVDRHDLGPSEACAATRQKPSRAFMVEAETLRALGLTVHHDPNLELDMPPFCAHTIAAFPEGVVTREQKNGLKADIAGSMVHVVESGEITLQRPPR